MEIILEEILDIKIKRVELKALKKLLGSLSKNDLLGAGLSELEEQEITNIWIGISNTEGL